MRSEKQQSNELHSDKSPKTPQHVVRGAVHHRYGAKSASRHAPTIENKWTKRHHQESGWS